MNINIYSTMQPYTNSYNEARTNYFTLLQDASSRWKQHIKMDVEDFDAITSALATLVASAELMKNKAHEYMESDSTLLRVNIILML